MATHSVNVSGISSSTTEAGLHDFFSFCGSIKSIDFKKDGGAATIHFEKPSSAKTALMLNGGTLDDAHLDVTSDTAHEDPEHHEDHAKPIDQADKPRAGIAAEYLAKGYNLSDKILARAIDMDNQQGISKRFLNFMHSLDTNVGSRALGPDKTVSAQVKSNVQAATQQVTEMDERQGYSKRIKEFYEKALASPIGQKVFSFYTSTSKQVMDIHEEAKRIAVQHKNEHGQTHEAQTPEQSPEHSTPQKA